MVCTHSIFCEVAVSLTKSVLIATSLTADETFGKDTKTPPPAILFANNGCEICTFSLYVIQVSRYKPPYILKSNIFNGLGPVTALSLLSNFTAIKFFCPSFTKSVASITTGIYPPKWSATN